MLAVHVGGAHIRGHRPDSRLRVVAQRLVRRRVGVQVVVIVVVVVVGGGAAVEPVVG